MRSSFKDHLRRALVCLEAETPSLHRALAESLGGRSIRIEVDDGVLVLGRRAGAWRFDGDEADVYARTRSEVIDALLQGDCHLEDAVLDGRVHLVGAIDDFLALDAALQLFVQAAVRAPGILEIQRDWESEIRAGAHGESDTTS